MIEFKNLKKDVSRRGRDVFRQWTRGAAIDCSVYAVVLPKVKIAG